MQLHTILEKVDRVTNEDKVVKVHKVDKADNAVEDQVDKIRRSFH